MNQKKVFITGSSGFIGKHFLRKLLKSNVKIACFAKNFSDDFLIEFGEKVELYQGDLMDKSTIEKSVIEFSPEYVYHLAGAKNRSNELSEFTSSIEVNYFGTLNLFECLINLKSLKLVTIFGTIEEYGHALTPFLETSIELPNSAYGLSKLATTKLAMIFHKSFNLPVVVLRPSIAYGPNQGNEMFIPALISNLLQNKFFKMTPGDQLRDFIFIDDLVDLLLLLFNSTGLDGQVFNIASGKSIKLKDLAQKIATALNKMDYLLIGTMPYRTSEIMDYTVGVNRANYLLNWQARTTISRGIELTIASYLDKQ